MLFLQTDENFANVYEKVLVCVGTDVMPLKKSLLKIIIQIGYRSLKCYTKI
jgi:hypothetical protein